ncbi:MAG: bifunctional (p)ppGpp synthetase/guanosine-3',5'-bis(diphosphate) 3'-pyrophosphohydrolase [Proteobacteria bacterium]|nr:bifunctional (p)ppGpp synthetase/guanosine-3',5'-bis(diphosphate) 3'-pyrophosphohydrolase [Pseudomonadota bacterium]
MTQQAKRKTKSQSKPEPKSAARPKVKKATSKAESKKPESKKAGGDSRLLISDLCEMLETYLDQDQITDIYNAYLFGAEAHEGQKRRSGEPYIYHPLEVARILAGMRMDAPSIIAAILHDVIEDTPTAKEHLVQQFGDEVAELVDSVSKISQIEFASKEEEQAENFRKMLLAMTRDIRVILIKLADRLHNMRTLSALRPDKQRRIARETMDIYAPIANRLGVRQWAFELEELCFELLYPVRYGVLDAAMKRRHGNRKAVVDKILSTISTRLEEEGVKGAVTGREKHLYSIYRKMRDKRLSFDQIYDVYAFRITVDSVDNCYRILGVVHNLFKPIPGRFKDYIAIPKANGYQSLHTIVFGPFGLMAEVQIRTEGMHRVADVGVAAHWLYKSGDSSEQFQNHALQWLKDLLDIQQEGGNPGEFLEHLKVDLFPDEIYVFTPNGEIKKLPRGATAVDFAYDVHTDVGNHCIGAKINHQLTPLRTHLRNGDHVEIVTSEWGRPSPSWLNYVATGRARALIRNYLKTQRHGESVSMGERLLDKALSDIGVELDDIDADMRKALLTELGIKSWDDLLAEIGLGKRVASIVAQQLSLGEGAGGEHKAAIQISGTEGVVVHYGRCCYPIPGDPIAGFLSAGRGIVVHTEDCSNVSEYRKQPDRWIDVEWEPGIDSVFPVALRVEAKNQRGSLASIAASISDFDANIDSVNFEEREAQESILGFVIEVRDRQHLATIMRHIRTLDSVVRMRRVKA